MTTDRMRTMTLALGLVLAAAPAGAQEGPVAIDPHWRGYLGCWVTSVAGAPGPMVCLVPTADRQTVDMMTVVGDAITSSTPITASGTKVQRTRDDCTGWETGRWSMDERRLYTTAEYTCGDGVAQQASGIIAMSGSDMFTRVEGVKTRSGTRVRIVRFEAQNDTAIIPASIRRRLPALTSLPMLGARSEAGADLSTVDVTDAAKAVDAPVVEAWLADRREGLVLAANDLRAMRDAGVPGSVIDMLVAVSNPSVFALAAGGKPGVRQSDPFQRRANSTEFAQMRREQMLMLALREASLWGYGFGNFGYGMNGGFSPFGMQGFRGAFPFSYWSPFGNGFNNGFNNGFDNGFNNGFNNGWLVGNTPYVIVPREPAVAEPRGRAVNGRGYTQGGSDGGTARPSGSVNAGESSGGSGGSSSGGASSGGSNSGGGSGRTAKPRP